jgi:hypothetical protein
MQRARGHTLPQGLREPWKQIYDPDKDSALDISKGTVEAAAHEHKHIRESIAGTRVHNHICGASLFLPRNISLEEVDSFTLTPADEDEIPPMTEDILLKYDECGPAIKVTPLEHVELGEPGRIYIPHNSEFPNTVVVLHHSGRQGGEWTPLPTIDHNAPGNPSIAGSLVGVHASQFGYFRVVHDKLSGFIVTILAYISDGQDYYPGDKCKVRLWVVGMRCDQHHIAKKLEENLRAHDYWVGFAQCGRHDGMAAHYAESFYFQAGGGGPNTDYPLTLNQLVQVRWRRGKRWYPARVMFPRTNPGVPAFGTYDIEYDDDTKEKMVLRQYIRERVKAGDVCLAKFRAGPRFFRAVVVAVTKTGTYDVEYDETPMTPIIDRVKTKEHAIPFDRLKSVPPSADDDAGASASAQWLNKPGWCEVNVQIPADFKAPNDPDVQLDKFGERTVYFTTKIGMEDEASNYQQMFVRIPVKIGAKHEAEAQAASHHSKSLHF